MIAEKTQNCRPWESCPSLLDFSVFVIRIDSQELYMRFICIWRKMTTDFSAIKYARGSNDRSVAPRSLQQRIQLHSLCAMGVVDVEKG